MSICHFAPDNEEVTGVASRLAYYFEFGATLIEMILFFLKKTVFTKGIKRMMRMIIPQAILFGGFLILYLHLKDNIPVLPLNPWIILVLGGVFWLINKLGGSRMQLW